MGSWCCIFIRDIFQIWDGFCVVRINSHNLLEQEHHRFRDLFVRFGRSDEPPIEIHILRQLLRIRTHSNGFLHIREHIHLVCDHDHRYGHTFSLRLLDQPLVQLAFPISQRLHRSWSRHIADENCPGGVFEECTGEVNESILPSYIPKLQADRDVRSNLHLLHRVVTSDCVLILIREHILDIPIDDGGFAALRVSYYDHLYGTLPSPAFDYRRHLFRLFCVCFSYCCCCCCPCRSTEARVRGRFVCFDLILR
mmetsp:Transcript_5243/g.7326  ORF Transcript_5243/g.7326 Transcript_5243/m.7326 type:complete len:252 (-) Transcript_5243:512-1267(-)